MLLFLNSRNISIVFFMLLFLIGPLLNVQALLFNDIFISSIHIKAALLILGLVYLVKEISSAKKIDNFSLVTMGFYSLSFLIILYFTFDISGFYTALMAFAYNYSLTIVLLPITFMMMKSSPLTGEVDWKLVQKFTIILVALNLYGVLQFKFNSVFISYDDRLLLINHGVKFDHLNWNTRAMSLFKSPLEFGLYNVFFFGFYYSIASYYNKSKYYLVSILCFLSVLATISRTAILILLLFALLIFFKTQFLKIIKKNNIGKNFYFIFTIFSMSVTFLILNYLDIIYISDTLLRSDNLIHRFYHWIEVLERLGSNFVIGKGTIQNGIYGSYHNLIIDNTFLGCLMATGIVGLIYFLLINALYMKNIIANKLRMSAINKHLTNYEIIFIVLIFVAGLFENLMHIWYFITFPVLFKNIFLLNKRS